MSVVPALVVAFELAAACISLAFAHTSRLLRVEQERRSTFGDARRSMGRLRASYFRAVEGTGTQLSAGEFSTLWAASVAVALLASLALSLPPLAAAIAALMGSALPWALLKGRQRAARRRFGDDLGDVLPLVASNLRGGLSLRQSIAPVAENMGEPVRGEFRILAAELERGVPTEEALAHMAERNDSRDLVLLASAVATTSVTGGNLADVVDSVAAAIRQRCELRRMVASKTSEQRASAKVLVAVPAALAVGLILTQEAWREFFLSSTEGMVTLVGAAALAAIGYWLALRMTDIRLD